MPTERRCPGSPPLQGPGTPASTAFLPCALTSKHVPRVGCGPFRMGTLNTGSTCGNPSLMWQRLAGQRIQPGAAPNQQIKGLWAATTLRPPNTRAAVPGSGPVGHDLPILGIRHTNSPRMWYTEMRVGTEGQLYPQRPPNGCISVGSVSGRVAMWGRLGPSPTLIPGC